jgi:hypothetical protein
MLQTFRLLCLVGFLAAACTPKPAPVPAPPEYKENPY